MVHQSESLGKLGSSSQELLNWSRILNESVQRFQLAEATSDVDHHTLAA